MDKYCIRTKDPNNHSDTETGTLSKSELISNNVALIHLLKGNIGIGVMAMPRSKSVDEHDTNDIDPELHLITLDNMNDIETVTSQ